MAHRRGGNQAASGEAITIKKYANRRLYNTATSSYVTLDHLCQMVKDGVDFVVFDAKTNDDITRSVLTQIIVEEESKGTNLLPINFLRQLISFYGDNMQWMVPRYLDQMMGSFSANQEHLRKSMQETLGGMFPTTGVEEMNKQNVALFEKAMHMFSPFGGDTPQGGKQNPETAAATAPEGETADPATLDHLKQQVDRLQRQLEALTKKQKS